MKFSDIPGHSDIKDHLKHLVDDDCIPHALLISGPAGSGKLALARAMSQYMHCRNHLNGDSCGVCPECLQHQSINYPDMHYVYPVIKRNGKISTDYIAQWREFMSESDFAPYDRWLDLIDAGNTQPVIYAEESIDILHVMNMSNFSAKYKVMIVWLPEKMVEAAANKLLKIIEEPYADSKFIFVSNEPQKILPTIFSRTQRVNVSRLSDSEISNILSNRFHIDYAAAMECAALSSGNINKAIESISHSTESDEFFNLFCDIMRRAYARDLRELKDISDSSASMGREKLRRFLAYCTHMLRENFITGIGNIHLANMNEREAAFSSKFSPFINYRNIEQLMQTFDSAYEDIGRNANPKIVLFDTFLSLLILIRK